MKRSELNKIKDFVLDYCKKNYTPIQVRPDFEEWLESTSYNMARKDELRQAHDENRGGLPCPRACSRVKTFIKLEEYPAYKHARWINSRSDKFKVFSGPFFKQIENVVYSHNGDINFIKHYPVQERPEVIDRLPKGMRYYGTDYTSFEKHFTASVMHAIEFVLYDYMLPCMTAVEKDCLFRTLSGFNNLKSRSGFRARVKARRMSGEMCTSLGNGFTNMMLALYLAHKKQGHIFGFVEGDDGIFATDFPLENKDYQKLGFEIKILEYEKIGDASFCGMIFSESGEIIRDPVAFLQKFSWTSSFLGAGIKIQKELLRAKALSAVYETPQCPIVGAAARYALQLTTGSAVRFIHDGYHDIPKDTLKIPEFAPHVDTRRQFQKIFKVNPETQIEIESKLLRGDFNVAHLLPLSRDNLHYVTRFLA